MNELTNQSAARLAVMIRTGKVSPVEVMEAHLKRIESLNPRLNAIVTLAPDAMEQAREAESALQKGEYKGPLHGVPVTIKDTFDTKNLRTTCGSALRTAHIPETDSVAATFLKMAGAIVLGKTNVSEMAMTYEADNPVFGRTNNPHDLRLTAGGSSGGEAAAVAAGLSPVGLGSDLMGSIRVPAHFCGIVGLKPTHGSGLLIGHTPPAGGPLMFGAVAGPLGRCVEDLSLIFQVLSHRKMEVLAGDLADLIGCQVAWYGADGATPVSPEGRAAVERAARALEEARLHVREELPPAVKRGPELWSRFFSRAAARYLKAAYEGQEYLAGPDAQFLLSASAKGAAQELDDFLEAWDERDRLSLELSLWMDKTPLIIAPVGAVQAFAHGARKVLVEGQELSIFRAFGYAQTFNVFGMPVATIPAGSTKEGLPVGVQIIGQPHAEKTVLAAATIIERSLGGARPPSDILSAD